MTTPSGPAIGRARVDPWRIIREQLLGKFSSDQFTKVNQLPSGKHLWKITGETVKETRLDYERYFPGPKGVYLRDWNDETDPERFLNELDTAIRNRMGDEINGNMHNGTPATNVLSGTRGFSLDGFTTFCYSMVGEVRDAVGRENYYRYFFTMPDVKANQLITAIATQSPMVLDSLLAASRMGPIMNVVNRAPSSHLFMMPPFYSKKVPWHTYGKTNVNQLLTGENITEICKTWNSKDACVPSRIPHQFPTQLGSILTNRSSNLQM